MNAKFRAWDKERQEMVYYFSSISPIAHNLLHIDLIGYELMQYTGFPDKNGNEICCGDIVKDTEGNIRTIIFKSGSFFGRLTVVPHLALLTDDEMYDCEIIGNIYSNPELLTNQ